MTKQTNRMNEWVKYTYDEMNRQVKQTNQLNLSTEYVYDLCGNRTAVIDGNKHTVTYAYDGLNRLISETNAEGGVAEYAYDYMGNVSSFTAYGGGGQKAVTTYTYDAAGNLLKETSPLGYVTSYTYDKEGNALSKTDENGKVTTYEYDALGQMTKRADGDGTAAFAYDKVGNLTSASGANGTVSFTYDALYRTTEVTNKDGSTTAYTYDAVGNRLSITYPDGKAVTTTYDTLGYVTALTDYDGTGVVYTRDAEGRPVKELHSDGGTTEYAYNAAGQLTLRKEVTAENSTRRQITYTYDDAGNVTSKNRTGVDIDKRDEILRYYYDDANQLIRTTLECKTTKYTYDLAGNMLSDGTYTYTYDLQNRLLSKTGKDGTTTYTYDAAGNLIKEEAPDGTVTYTYNAQNKLVKGERSDGQSSSYTYNALGVRIENEQVRFNRNAGNQNSDLKDGSHGTDYLDFLADLRATWQRIWETEIGTTVQPELETVTRHYVVDYLSVANRDMMVTEDGGYVTRYVYDENSTRISAEFSYADGTERGTANADGEYGENLQSDIAVNEIGKVWYRHSMLGSTLFVVDSKGNVVTHMIYDPWGNPLLETYTDTNLSGLENLNNFTGYTWDETLGLYFAQNRFYDAETKRFTQEDIVKDSVNWYAYCGNNPVSCVDPDGRLALALAGAGAAAGVVGGTGAGITAGAIANGIIGTAAATMLVGSISAAKSPSKPASPLFSGIDNVNKSISNVSSAAANTAKTTPVTATAQKISVITQEKPQIIDLPATEPVGNIIADPLPEPRGAMTTGGLTPVPQAPSVESFPPLTEKPPTILSTPIGGFEYNQRFYCEDVGGAVAKPPLDVFGRKKTDYIENKRHWTEDAVREVYEHPYTTRPSTDKATGQPATAYYNEAGDYIVVNNVTGEVIQASAVGDTRWVPDSEIQNPYRPER